MIAPELSAAADVTILKIEPGTYSPIVARSRNGWPAAAAVRVKAATAVVGSAIAFALNVGCGCHRQDPAGPRIEHHDGAPVGAQGLDGGLLELERQAQGQAVALGRAGASFESRSSSEFGLPWPLSSAL